MPNFNADFMRQTKTTWQDRTDSKYINWLEEKLEDAIGKGYNLDLGKKPIPPKGGTGVKFPKRKGK